MQLNKRKIIFYWNGWVTFLLILVGMEIVLAMGIIRVKASNQVSEIGLTNRSSFDEKLYQITYNSSGGDGEMPVSELPEVGGNLTLNKFSRIGYTFAGWAVSEGGPVMYLDGAIFYPTKDMTLYAVWEVNKYAVSLEEVGEYASGASRAVSYGSMVSVYAGTREGYTFDGWTVKSGEILLEDTSNPTISFPMPDENVCLYANWVVNSYQIILLEGGEGNSGSIVSQYQSTVTIQSGVKKGYTFTGWIVEAGDAVLANPSDSTTTFTVGTSDVRVKALWKANTYHITVTDTGEGGIDEQNVDYGEKVIINAGTKDGFYFGGWRVEKGIISLENPFDREIVFLMPDTDLELQAIWKKIVEVKADFNNIFHERYDRDGYYKDGCYNIGQKICIEKDMLNVTIGFLDGSTTLAKSEEYELGNCKIEQLGENQIEIILTVGNSNLFCSIEVMGYSSELDTIMKDLGLLEGDYSGLASRVEQIQAEIGRLGAEIEKYRENLIEVKELLKEAGEDVELTGKLEEDLEKIQRAIEGTVEKLRQAEEELHRIEEVITIIIDELGLDKEELEKYKSLSDILKKIQEEIEKIKENEAIVVEEINQIAAKLGIVDRIFNFTDANREIFFKIVEEKIDEIKRQLELYQETMGQLKEKFEIDNTGSLESQLKEVVEKIESKQTYLEDLKDEIERQLEGNYGEIQIEGMSQIDVIFARIRTLKEYANGLKQFYTTLQKLLGFDSTNTKEEIYECIVNIKDKVMEYDLFLNQAEALLGLDTTNGSGSLVTGEQTKEELDRVYTKMGDMLKELVFLEEMFRILLEKEEVSIENKEEFLALIEEIKRQKEETNQFINQLKELLELENQAGEQEIYNKISAMKDTLANYWLYLSRVEDLIQIEDGSHTVSGSAIVTGPAVTGRLTTIYEQLTDMVEQQTAMFETIKELLEKEHISSEMIQELQEIQDEMIQQKQQTDLFLKELRELLELEDSANYKEVIHTITDMKELLKHYIVVFENLMQQLKIIPPSEEPGDITEQVKEVFYKVVELIKQLEEEIKKSETAEQTILFLEQKIKILSIEEEENSRLKEENAKLREENSKLKEENNTLKKENDKLKKERIQKDSTESSNCADRDVLERENRLHRERIIEIEKQIQSQAKEIEQLVKERAQLVTIQSDRDRQIGEQKEQIELFEKQLLEKEKQRKELETKLQIQEPMQSLLEKNQISYEELIILLKNQGRPEIVQNNSKDSNEKIVDKKETIKENSIVKELETIEENSTVKETIIQKEKREHIKTAIAESEELLEETEESSSSLEEFLEDLEEREDYKENDTEKSDINWAILFVIIILFVLIGAILFVLCGKDTI